MATNKVLEGVRILENGKFMALPLADRILSEFGAEVVKIESYVALDPTMDIPAYAPGVAQIQSENGHMTLYSTDVPRTMASLFELVSDQRLAFQDMTVRQATLEDVFLKLTGRRIRA